MACNILTFPLPIFQWDSNISLDVNASIISEDGHQYVHYQHKGQTEVYSIEVADGKAAIPNIILQTAGAFEAYAYIADDAHGKTLVRTEFTILPRPLPPEYIYDPTPVITYPELVDLVEDLTALRDALSNVSASAETLPAGSAASAEATLSTDGLAFEYFAKGETEARKVDEVPWRVFPRRSICLFLWKGDSDSPDPAVPEPARATLWPPHAAPQWPPCWPQLGTSAHWP